MTLITNIISGKYRQALVLIILRSLPLRYGLANASQFSLIIATSREYFFGYPKFANWH
jgi:hypothetical protein